jgi:hypothetical protein
LAIEVFVDLSLFEEHCVIEQIHLLLVAEEIEFAGHQVLGFGELRHGVVGAHVDLLSEELVFGEEDFVSGLLVFELVDDFLEELRVLLLVV